MQIKSPFIPAQELNNKFEVLGRFYAIDIPEIEPVECRDVLEIRCRKIHGNDLADAVFVMMNPGSSRPLTETKYLVNSTEIAKLSDVLVPTVPDPTQYQVMRVMYYSDWKYVRVINLSDLRDPKSASFAERYTSIERTSGIESHSIFAPERSDQLRRYLLRKAHAPIVCAWGVGNDLSPLISRATKALASEKGLTGLAKPGHKGKYFHPLPTTQQRKELWVNKILNELNSNN